MKDVKWNDSLKCQVYSLLRKRKQKQNQNDAKWVVLSKSNLLALYMLVYSPL